MGMFNVAIWGTVGQWVAASATLTAVAVALFKDDILRAQRRPRLHVTAELKAPHCRKTFLGPYNVQRVALTMVTAPCYFLRLWIDNRGRSRAERVQVFVASVSRRSLGGSFETLESFMPMNLRWSHGLPDGTPEIVVDGISSGMGKHCDLLRIVHPDNRVELGDDLEGSEGGTVVGSVQLEVVPNNRAQLLAPGVYRLTLPKI